MTPLFVACEGGHVDVMRLLIDHGAHVRQLRNDGATPLFAACYWGHFDAAKLLIDEDADVGQADIDGESPLLVALVRHHAEVARLLLREGADIKQATSRAFRTAEDVYLRWGTTPLSHARKLDRDGKARVGSAPSLILHWHRTESL